MEKEFYPKSARVFLGLGFSWEKLIFFIVVCMELCFGFCAENTVDNTGIFSLQLLAQSLFFFSLHTSSKTQLGQLIPTYPRDILHHICPAYKAGGRRENWGGCIQSNVFLSSQLTLLFDKTRFSWKCLNTCPPMESSEFLLLFSLPAQPWLYLLHQPTSFLIFPTLSPFHCRGVTKSLRPVQLPAGVKSQQPLEQRSAMHRVPITSQT